ncbi:MAG: HYExAFE family protein [Planctomycetota bacterium]
MATARHHYERAIETYMRARRTPYVSVNEARRALLPPKAKLEASDAATGTTVSLKSFDFVVYGLPFNLLVEVKGRKVARSASPSPATRSKLQSWVTEEDVRGLDRWQRLFGDDFRAAFVFVYRCERQPPDALFQEVFEYQSRWYAVRAVLLDDYRREMKTRSPQWKTVHVPTEAFERISGPLASASPDVPRRISSVPRLQQDLSRSVRKRFGRIRDEGGTGVTAADSDARFARPPVER